MPHTGEATLDSGNLGAYVRVLAKLPMILVEEFLELTSIAIGGYLHGVRAPVVMRCRRVALRTTTVSQHQCLALWACGSVHVEQSSGEL